MTKKDIAGVCHEVNRAYCESQGDHSQLPWELAPQWQIDSALHGVQLHLDNPDAGPEISHDHWWAEKAAAGWQYGEVKDPERKTHPCMVRFEQLPKAQQAKDHIFRAVVHALKPFLAVLALIILSGCISPYKVPGTTDQFLVTKHSEIRSPFGTNGGYDFLERCTGPKTVVMFYFEGDFVNCRMVSMDELESRESCASTRDGGSICTSRFYKVDHKSSQGQGGQIVSGMMNAAALGGVAAAAGSAGNAASSASSTVINNVTVPRGHHR